MNTDLTMPAATASNARPQPLPPAIPRRVRMLRWLRKAHGWIGLWGAALGLLFGFTGVLLNHRNVLKLPLAQTQESVVQLALPTPQPADAKALARWLQAELKLDREAGRIREEPARAAQWGDEAVTQPARWTIGFVTPASGVQAEYWLGNRYVSVKRSSNNVFGTLNNLHKGVGLGIGWVLLVDTLAGSILLLSLTGVILWTGLNRRRVLGAAIGFGSLGLTVTLALTAL